MVYWKLITHIRRLGKPKANIKVGVIYILKALNTNATLYKIGKSKGLKNRLNNYNSANTDEGYLDRSEVISANTDE